MSGVANRYRSAVRTLRRGVGLGPKKITNSDLGTEAEQCEKFRRFEELYDANVESTDSFVRDLLWYIRLAQMRLYKTIVDMVPESGPEFPVVDEQFKKRLNYIITDFELATINQNSTLSNIDDELPKSRILKEELRFYIPFQQSYIRDKLKYFRDNGKININTFIDCLNKPGMYKIPAKSAKPTWRTSRKTRRNRSGLKR
jgi:hypothetical protein